MEQNEFLEKFFSLDAGGYFMKKYIALFLSFAILTLSLYGCGANEQSDSSTQQQTDSIGQTEDTSNPLMKAEFSTADVKSGLGDNAVGKRGFIKISKSDLNTITAEQFNEFVKEIVENSELNWVSIICDDGTGLCFTGSNTLVIDYGDLDQDGAVTKSLGTIMLTEDGYVYTPSTPELSADLSVSQKNALAAAEQYLSISAFSRTGLIQQLKYDQYSEEDATYAADNCGADWNEQAANAAMQYLEISPFSKAELIAQLKYDGFTDEQADYGAFANGFIE